MDERTSRDLELMRAVARRDSSAFRELFARHASTVLGYLVNMLHNRAEAEEVLQEAFLQVWDRAERFRPERGTPLAWTLLMARSRALDRLRSSGARRRREEEVGRDQLSSASIEAPGTERLEADEARLQVQRALGELPAEQRRCIELAFYEGLTHSQIAESLSQPLGTVKSRILMGMKKLRRELAEVRS